MGIKISQVTRPGYASVNSWLLEDEAGVVLIDTQRTLSAASEVVAAIRASGKPLQAVIITHPHPDHFGGLASILESFPGTPVYASENAQQVIESDSNGLQAATRNAVPDDTPEQFPAPDHVFRDGEILKFGEVELAVEELGPGESETMSMISAPAANALFVGDVVANRMTGFLLEGRSADWIAQIDRILRDYGQTEPTIYPGHGAAGTFGVLLEAEREWLVDLRDMTRKHLDGVGLSETDIEDIRTQFESKYVDYPAVAAIPDLLVLNIQAVAKEIMENA